MVGVGIEVAATFVIARSTVILSRSTTSDRASSTSSSFVPPVVILELAEA